MSDCISTPPLDTCGCCKAGAPAPVIYNRPGLPALSYRLRTHAAALAAMKARLGKGLEIQLDELDEHGRPKTKRIYPLSQLTTRAPDDPAIAWLDAWAVVTDVLTFYQERLANEGFLRTATERRSVLELARAIGYELKPGVAAGGFLAFTVETAPGAPGRATVDAGVKVLSIPGQNERPQTFETVEKIEAQAAWNALQPQLTEPPQLSPGDESVFFQGLATNLKPGDALLLLGRDGEGWDCRRVQAVAPDKSAGRTLVSWQGRLNWRPFTQGLQPPENGPKIYAWRQRASLFGHNAMDWRLAPDSVKAEFLTPGLRAQYFEGQTPGIGHPKLSRIDPQVNFDWGSDSPDPAIPSDNFSARWTGWLKPPASGRYIFYTTSDDGVRLWIDGQMLIDNWTDHAVGDGEDNGLMELTAGRLYPIKLEYYEHTGQATIKLAWSGPDRAREIIPPSYFYYPDDEWPGFTISAIAAPEADTVQLDGVHPQIVPDSWLGLANPDDQRLFQVARVAEDSRTNFGLTAKTTRITLKGKGLEKFDNRLRDTAALAQSEELELAERPLTAPVGGDRIVLDSLEPGLTPGQTLVVSGKPGRALIASKAQGLGLNPGDGAPVVSLSPGDSLQVMGPVRLAADLTALQPDELLQALADASPQDLIWQLLDRDGRIGLVAASSKQISLKPAAKGDALLSEIVFVDNRRDAVSSDRRRTTVTLREPLQNCFDRTTVTINANVARATHGETVLREVLGSGDGARPNQRFVLKKPPLTYVSAATASGAQSTLTVRVNELEWQPAPSLYGLEAGDQSYIVRLEHDGKAAVIFGDGRSGARLPSGSENVRATYRSGIGPDGNVAAHKLTLLQTRPLGIRGVTNPLAASGGAAPEVLENARRNAPLTVLTLDRIVSWRDFEDFARAFAGIGKAQAVSLWNGHLHLVHLTVADAQGEPLDPKAELYKNLTDAIGAGRDPLQPVVISGFSSQTFSLAAGIIPDRRYLPEDVISRATKALLAAFTFETRSFGQPVTAAEVVTIIQAVPGVIAVDLDRLTRDPVAGDGVSVPTAEKVRKAQRGLPLFSKKILAAKKALISREEAKVIDKRFPRPERVSAIRLGGPLAILPAGQVEFDLDTGLIQPAELLLINPRGISLSIKEEAP